MFRWLPGETYSKGDLTLLAKSMIQAETAVIIGPDVDVPPDIEIPADHKPPAEGPDVIQPFPQVGEHAGDLLDTVFGSPEPDDENPFIPAGYTYFGQFIDHDLTFDPNSSLQKQNDPDGLDDFRTPRFDLDSLYGRGPDDQPYLYQDSPESGGGIRFRLGRTPDGSADRPGELQRNIDGRALIGDPRNDENAIICQLQAVFLNFHNRVIDTLEQVRPQLAADHHACFVEAQRIVRWHYQYIVLNDYLRRIVGDKTWHEVFQGVNASATHPPHPHLKFYRPKNGQAYMPVEFSVAAFRFGHSMIRPSYALRPNDSTVGGDPAKSFSKAFHRIPLFSSDGTTPATNLHGFAPLPPNWEIDWNMFFAKGVLPTELVEDGKRQVKPQAQDHVTQPGYRIDTKLVDPLAMLPPTVAKSGNEPDGIPVLAYRNLLRGSAFELPSGQNVARALELPVLPEDKLWGDINSETLKDSKTNPFAYRAPLWYYVLKEAELTRASAQSGEITDTLGGHHLGPVGGRIVSEVIVGIALNDHSSYLYQDSTWTPADEAARSGFAPGEPITDMYQLIHWTTGGTMSFLNAK
ncbi:heme peroxidase family protein [Paraburkholderia sabiae]|uniref:Heme peroxidase family protein n=1 Tax=Paraburkholderia sabiae TaxID=273251 RepID=A0ABU9QMP0_9BURK|nr:heme peroxidase family protein [Paraburkholderia sabiae]WJZ79146.1 heme peroxidase family protein [Paraburkholderia sabiae]